MPKCKLLKTLSALAAAGFNARVYLLGQWLNGRPDGQRRDARKDTERRER